MLSKSVAAHPLDQIKHGLVLNVAVRQGAADLELLADKDETLLHVRGDALLVLDLLLDVMNSV